MALDIEWAHAMAPGAKIVLVEAASSSFSDLFKAVDVATSLVKAAGGGGPSKYEAMPGYQITSGVKMPAGLKTRGVPDISFDADPYTGVSVYDSTSCQGMSGWMVFGGTSVSSTCLAGLANSSGGFEYDSPHQLQSSYVSSVTSSYFYDVLTGTAGTGWDFVTGIGTPRTLFGF